MFAYLKYLPLLSVIGKYPAVVKVVSDSLPDAEKIAARFQPIQGDVQSLIIELETAIRQIDGLAKKMESKNAG